MGGEVQVGASELFKLPAAEHEVEREMGGGLEVGVNGGKEVQIVGVEPELANGSGGAGVHTAGNALAQVEVKGREEVKSVSPGKRRDGDAKA